MVLEPNHNYLSNGKQSVLASVIAWFRHLRLHLQQSQRGHCRTFFCRMDEFKKGILDRKFCNIWQETFADIFKSIWLLI